MKFFAGILTGIFVVTATLAFVFGTGAYNVAASSPPGKIETKLASYALRRSVERRAPVKSNPFTKPEDVRFGLAHYKENCLDCHGAPGVEESEFGQGLNPPAPDLTLPAMQKMPDGELFWIVSNGIRSTGMPAFSPTHKEEELWKIVAFVRHLPEIRADEQKFLKAGREEGEHHAEAAEAEAKPEATDKDKPGVEGKQGHTHPPGTAPHKD